MVASVLNRSWATGFASVGASGKLTPAIATDATYGAAKMSVTATSGTSDVVACCQTKAK